MNLLDMLGINRNDVLDFYKLLERGVLALEDIALSLDVLQKQAVNALNMAERGK